MVAHVVPDRDMRGPGCDERCTVVQALLVGVFGRSELLLHDATAHEAYGRWLAEPARPSEPEVRASGPLAVNLATLDVAVGGEAIFLTPTELRLLLVLVRRLGEAVSQEELLSCAWGPTWVGEAHVLRVNISRLRSRIGPAGRLITTLATFGYRLEAVPPGDVGPLTAVRRYEPLGRWSRLWEHCRICGTTQASHRQNGVCNRRACRLAASR